MPHVTRPYRYLVLVLWSMLSNQPGQLHHKREERIHCNFCWYLGCWPIGISIHIHNTHINIYLHISRTLLVHTLFVCLQIRQYYSPMASVGGGNDGGAYQPMFQISDPVRARVLIGWFGESVLRDELGWQLYNIYINKCACDSHHCHDCVYPFRFL